MQMWTMARSRGLQILRDGNLNIERFELWDIRLRPVGTGRSEGGPRWSRRVLVLVSNSGTTVVCPPLQQNQVDNSLIGSNSSNQPVASRNVMCKT